MVHNSRIRLRLVGVQHQKLVNKKYQAIVISEVINDVVALQLMFSMTELV